MFLGSPLFAANFLHKDKSGFLFFRCEGRLGAYKAKVRSQGWGHYQVIGPYISDVVPASNSFDAATLACGEQTFESTRHVIGLKSFKDY
ncbi:MAG: hypothetical protein QNL04_00120 [SAR324 cluster bacterium]|nr:hypothetical protein [SAR324 cluster bacterium]